jgi:E3 ubiquitin-protein ligase NEDD4
LAEQLFNPAFGLFQYSAVNQMCLQINPNSGIANEFHLRYFHMAGRFLGKAIMDGQVVPAHLVQPLYKHLLGWPIMYVMLAAPDYAVDWSCGLTCVCGWCVLRKNWRSLKDLEHVDDVLYRSLMEMLHMEDVSLLYLDFTVTEDHMGVTDTVELAPGGADKLVDNSNVAEYLEANLKYRLHERLKEQLLEMLKGFSEVVPEPLLSVFDFQEIELLLCGLPNIDMDDWIANTEYTGDFAAQGRNHKVVQWFWEVRIRC